MKQNIKYEGRVNDLQINHEARKEVIRKQILMKE